MTEDGIKDPFRPEDFTPEDPFVREILETGSSIV